MEIATVRRLQAALTIRRCRPSTIGQRPFGVRLLKGKSITGILGLLRLFGSGVNPFAFRQV